MKSSVEIFNSEMEELSKRFLSAQLPPNWMAAMKTEFLDYESRTMLKAKFPVMEEQLNPMRTMQGGFITAAFDNAFGPLSYVAARNPCTTLDLHTNFIRPIAPGDELNIIARVVSRGHSTIHLSAEAVNSKGKLIATSTTNMVVMKQ